MPWDGLSPARVLVIDDLQGVRQLLRSVLSKAGHEVLEAEDGRQGLDRLRAESPDLVLVDIRMPGLDGFAVLEHARADDPELPIIMVTPHGDTDSAVQAMQQGAYDYLSKPFRHAEVLAAVERAVERRRLASEVRTLHDQLARVAPLADQLGTSDAIQALLDEIERVAPTDSPVTITAEAGSGAEVVARTIHARSDRRHGPFVTVGCGAVPGELIERELFGHERDAFPGADRQRPGQIELAAGGTLFLTDVDALPLAAQDHLLSFLREGEVVRVGGSESIPADVRVIAATAADLDEAVAGERFRRDLSDRLAAARLAIPPLRERPDDIVFLVQRLLEATNRELHQSVEGVSPAALDLLVAHPWPGNLRELRHAIRRAVLLADQRIEPQHLALPTAGPEPEQDVADESGLPLVERKRRAVERVETRALGEALAQAGGDKHQAAAALDISYKTLLRKIKKYGLKTPCEANR
ncbi:MAG: sigma-54-dependent transcriptional regulator [Planctomycetota bacterium]